MAGLIEPAPVAATQPAWMAETEQPSPGVDTTLWLHRTGSPWRGLPKGFGPWQSVSTRFDRWAHAGVRQRALECLAQGRDCSVYMVDSSIARAGPLKELGPYEPRAVLSRGTT